MTPETPPSAITLPLALLFHPHLPAYALKLWLQLRLLAGESGETPPLAQAQLTALTGLPKTTLYNHLKLLVASGMLASRPAPARLQVYSFPEAGEASQVQLALSLPASSSAEPPAPQAAEPEAEAVSSASPVGRMANPSPIDRQLRASAPVDPIDPGAAPLSGPGAGASLGSGSPVEAAAPGSNMRTSGKPDDALLKPPQLVKFLALSEQVKRGAASKIRKSGGSSPPPGADLPETDPARLYRQVFHLSLRRSQREWLAGADLQPDLWRETLQHWSRHAWNPKNLPGMLDLYQRGGPSACRYCQPGPPQGARLSNQERSLAVIEALLQEADDGISG